MSLFDQLWREFWDGLERCLTYGWSDLGLLMGGCCVAWWVYVPVHELLHAAGCLMSGGSVSRLEIASLYGGALWAKLFPFVVAGGDYAGRLAGFATGGSDLVYLVTVFFPYVLTLWPGVWLLYLAGRTGRSFLFGLALPLALAPWVALFGDAYEIGSILVTQIPPWSAQADLLRSDDFWRVVGELRARDSAPWGGAVLGLLIGTLWAGATYLVGRQFALRLRAHSSPRA